MATVRACSITAKALAAFVAGFALTSAAFAESAAFARATGASMRLDTRQGVRIAAKGASETIAYSPRWGADGGVRGAPALPGCTVTSDGATLMTASEEGEVEWSPTSAGAHTLTHTAGDVAYTAQFTVLGDDVAQHAGALVASETWGSNQVHLVMGDFTVPSGKTLTIEPGAVVKFMTGTSLTVNGTCVAYGVIFTHVNDDTAGGDTLMDGDAAKPVMDGYKLSGNIYEDDATEERYTASQTLTSSISGTLRLKGHKVYLANSSITVSSGATLTLLPGAIIKFASGCSMTVNGTLDARGTRAEPIVFTSIKDDDWGGDSNEDGEKTRPEGGNWTGLYVNGTANLTYCIAMYAAPSNERGNIECKSGGRLTMNGCTVAHSLYDGVWNWGGTIKITNSIFFDCGNAVCPYQGSTTCDNCVMAECNYGYMDWSHWVGGTFRNCIFFGMGMNWSDTNGAAEFQAHSTVKNCCFYNPEGYAKRICTKDGVDGCLYADPKFLDPDNGDFRIKAGSPCVDAADSTVAPELDYWGQPRKTALEEDFVTGIPDANGEYADIGVYEVMPDDVQGDVDLVPVAVSSADAVTPGEALTVEWKVTNRGENHVSGSWRDSISFVSENGQVVTLGGKVTTAVIRIGETNTCTATFTVPAMAEGKWRLKVNVNSYHDIFEGSLFANNALTSDRTVEIALPSIDPAQGATDGVINAGVPKVLKLTFAKDEKNRMVHLDVPAGVKVTYGFGFMPRGNSASGTVVASDTGVRFRVPEDATDVYVALESDETTAYELSYSKDRIVIASVTPNTLPSSGQVTVTITGAGFVPSNTVELVGGGKSVVPESVQYVDAGTLVTTIDCAKLAAGTSCDLQVRDGETVAISANAVAVAAVQGKGKFWARLVVPESVRQGRVVACYVEYGNSGTADLDAQIVQVAVDGDSLIGFPDGVCDRQKLQFMASGLSMPFGKIKRGESNRLAFNFKMVHTGSLSLYTSYGKDRLEEFGLGTQDTLAAYAKAASIAGIYGDNPTSYEDVSFWAKRLTTGFVGVIAGTVSDESGNRLTMMPVACKDAEGNVVQSIQADSNGDFAFVVDAPGAYKVVCSTLSKDITIDDSNASQRLSLVVAASPHVEINVVGAEEPIVVSVTKSVDFDVGDGASQLRICDANTVVLREFQEDVSYRVALRSGKKGAYVKVVGSDIDQYIQVELKPLVSVSGCIHDSQSAAWRAGMLSVRLVGGGFDESARVDANTGRFELHNVPEGDYVVMVDGTDVEYALANQYSITAESSSIDIRPDTQALTAKRMMTKSFAMPLKTSLGDWLLDWVESDERKESSALANEAMAFWMAHRPQKPPLRYRCAYNMSVYNLDLDDYLNFSQRLIDFMQLSSKTSKMEMIAYRMKFIHHAADFAGDIYGLYNLWKKPALSGAKQAIVSVVGDVEGRIVDGAADLAAINEESDLIVEKVIESLSEAVDVADALSYIKIHRRILVDHRSSIYKKFSKGSAYLSAAALIVDFILDFSDAFEAYARQAEAAEKCENAIMFMRSELALFKDAFEEYKDIAFNFGRYHNCEDGTDLYVPALEERSPSVPQSCDPNEMVGPMGKGDPETERFVKPGEWMTYTVYFENKADATAATQEVTVTNPLSEWLDWSTFEMGEVAFNNQIDLGLVGKKNGTSEVTMNGTNYAVRTELKLDEKTGVADWYMRIVDPTTETGWPEDVFAGFLPPNDETFRGEGHLTYRVKVREDAPDGVRIDNSATIVFDYNPPIVTDPAWWNTVSTLTEEMSGQYVNLDLVEELGIEIPDDVDYALGDKVTVKVEGLAKGLKVVTTPVYEDPEAKKKVIVGYKYMIEGVPTEAIDFDTRPMYARVTTTYKDKTKTADGTGKIETLQPIPLSIVPAKVRTLAAGVLNEVYEPADIAELWPEVKDAKVNPTEWSFKGWPAGIKYNNKATDVSWSYKGSDGKSYGAIAVPYTVYGQPTKAGEFPITATWKHKLDDNKTTVSETFSAVLTVWGDVEDEFRYEDQAYVATATKTLDATWKSFSGLPTGIKYTTKLIAADTKKGTPEYPAYSLYGTPTKAGVFAVTATKVDPNDAKKTVKETFLWKVAPPTAPTFALDTGTAPVEDLKAQIVQGANQSFAIAASEGAKVTASGLPTGLKLVQDKTTKLYSVEGVASKPGEYFVTFKTVLNGVTTVTTTAFTVKGNPFVATYRGYSNARPAVGAAVRLGVAEVTVAAAGTVKLTYTEGKTKYTASVKSYDWDDETGKGTAEGLVLKVSSADKTAGYGDRKATVTFEDFGTYLKAKLDIADADGTSLNGPANWFLYETVKTTEVPLPASQTFVFQNEDGGIVDAIATVSVAYDANKATAAFSGKLYDGTAVKATVPVLRQDEDGTSDDYVFAPFIVIAKDGTVYRFDSFSSEEDGGCIDWVGEDGEVVEESWSTPAEYTSGDKKFAELVPEAGSFTFGWGSDAEIVGAAEEKFTFVQTLDKNKKPAGVAIYDVDPQPDEKPLATVTAKIGKKTGAISVSFTSKKGAKAKYAVELVWRDDQLFAGHVTRTWKDGKISCTAYGTAEVKRDGRSR